MPDQLEQQNIISEKITNANQQKQALKISAGNTKSFYGNSIQGEPLDVSQYRGIIDYEPSELFITARCGTSLTEIEDELNKQQQMLAFEPPHFGQRATIGGTIACGFSGPRRPYSGSARDNILGAHIINGKGEYLEFGGHVMKNVAGYDVSRAMCGALGTLGVIMQVSLKVIPKPEKEITIVFQTSKEQRINKLFELSQTNLPITASYIEESLIYIRLAGLENSLNNICGQLEAETLDNSTSFWKTIKEHQRDSFQGATNLWRINVPNNTADIDFGDQPMLIEWNGGLRWLYSTLNADEIRNKIHESNGHATLFRSDNKSQDRFTEPSSTVKSLHKNLKHAFDPDNILNPGRMYAWC